MKVEISEAANWTVRNQDFTYIEFRLTIKDGLPLSMQDELEDHPEDYRSLTYYYWCDLLSKIDVKDERKRAAAHIKNIDSARAASLSDSNDSVKIWRKKKASTGVLRSNKLQKKAHKHHGIQKYCILCKKAGMPELKYMLYSSEYCTCMSTNRTIKDVMGGSVRSRADTLKQYNNSEKNGRNS